MACHAKRPAEVIGRAFVLSRLQLIRLSGEESFVHRHSKVVEKGT